MIKFILISLLVGVVVNGLLLVFSMEDFDSKIKK